MNSEINQIKSFVANSTRKEVTNFFVFMGGVSGDTNIFDETDISLISRITKNETCLVVPRINWQSNREYEPYYFGYSGEQSYCYNEVSGMVYLCVGKNQPSGLLGESRFGSTVSPTHIFGVVTYSDGYSWFAMYKIDQELSSFLTETELPVNILNDYTKEDTSLSLITKYNSFCSGGAGVTGDCLFFYTKDTVEPVSGIPYKAGDRVLGIGSANWNCLTCHEFGSLLNYKSIHINNSNEQNEVERNPISILRNEISSEKLEINNRFYVHFKNYEYSLIGSRAIESLHLDVSSLSIEDRVLNTQTADIKILDANGTGAKATITTYYDIRRNAFIANGILLQNKGYNYIDPQFFISGTVTDKLQMAIKPVIIPIISDPSIILPNSKVLISKSIGKQELTEIGTEQVVFSKIGILKNVKNIDLSDPTQTLQNNQPLKARTTTKITFSAKTGVDPGKEVPQLSEGDIIYLRPGINTSIIKNINQSSPDDYLTKVVSSKTIFDPITFDPTSLVVEIPGVDEFSTELFKNSSIEIESETWNTTSINKPIYRLDTTQFIASKKATKTIRFPETGSVPSIKLTFLI